MKKGKNGIVETRFIASPTKGRTKYLVHWALKKYTDA